MKSSIIFNIFQTFTVHIQNVHTTCLQFIEFFQSKNAFMTKLLHQVEDQHYIRQTSPLLSESVFLKLDESLLLALYIVCVFF